MAQDGEPMKTKRSKKVSMGSRPEWPVGKPVPAFRDAREKDSFWQAYEENIPTGGPKRRAQKAREHVYRIRFDDAEIAALHEMADRRGVTASLILRELVRVHWARLHSRTGPSCRT